MKKVAIICSPGMDNHLQEIIQYLGENYETKICVTNDQEAIYNVSKWADVIWIEWGDQAAINVTRQGQLLFGKQVILRIHSYEVFTNYLDYIKWSAVTDLVFVAEHIRNLAIQKFPRIRREVDRIHVIPNGIDVKRFKGICPENNKQLAYLGFINFKKAPLLLFTAFAELLKMDASYKLHIGGTFQEERYALYLRQMSEDLDIKDNIIIYDWVEKPEDWLQDKSHILCTSVLESQGKGIMEAMAMGLKPIIHNFVGAKNIYPKKYLWNTVSEFCNMIVMSSQYDPEEYREYVVDNYEMEEQHTKIKNIIDINKKPISVFMADNKVKPITLSVTMIMRDEEKNIGRCLESVKGIADEIVIVDTGSIDNSVAIAEAHGAKVYHHPWEDDFSLHRNQVIGYASGDWMLQIDADEELVINDKGNLKAILAKINPEYNGVSIVLRDTCIESGTQFNASRIFRRGFVEYHRAVHNKPIYEGASKFGSVLIQGVEIVHYGSHYQISKEESKKKGDRTRKLLIKSLRNDPDDYELLFYFMQLEGTVGNIEKAVEYGEKYLACKNKCDGFNDSVYYSIIRLNMEIGNIEKARHWLREAQILLPGDLDIAFVTTELGVITGNGQLLLEGARNYIKQYKRFQESPDLTGCRFIFSLKPDSLYFVLKHMTAYLLGDGVSCLDLLKGSIGNLSVEQQAIAVKEIEEILSPIGVKTN